MFQQMPTDPPSLMVTLLPPHPPALPAPTCAQAYYPETLGELFIINAPWVFTPLWAMVRPWLDPVTAAKFHVLGSKFQKQLLEVIDADQLPVEYGGTCRCTDMRWGDGCIPKQLPYVPPDTEEAEK